jgi:rare lipoprotein A
MTEDKPFRQRGLASWYGRQFHGNRTSSGEIYDMFAMTAAHPTLPIPSYVRVRHLASGATVIVRVNDRGPFKHDRVIDLSYAAAVRLGYAAGVWPRPHAHRGGYCGRSTSRTRLGRMTGDAPTY